MNHVFPSLFVLLTLSLMMSTESKEITCSNKSFVCYDETRFYQCVTNDNGDRSVKGYLHTCPLGLVCNNLNESECEEDISKEFLIEPKYYFKFGGTEGRKHIIDD